MLRNLLILTSQLPASSGHAAPPVSPQAVGSDVHAYESTTHFIYWSGFVYTDGKQSGVDSVRHLSAMVLDGAPHALTQLKGVYMVATVDKVNGNLYAFVDKGGLFNGFYSVAGVSSSFLRLVAAHQLNFEQVSHESLVRFIHFGYVPFGRTLCPAIMRLSGEQLICISPGGEMTSLTKKIPGFGSQPPTDFETALQKFASSVSAEKISVDLTGGIDSRLVAVMLDYFGVPFEIAVSGSDDDEDVSIAREIAKLLNRPIFVTHHDVQNFEDSLPALFEVCDALFNLADAHGPLQNQFERQARGTTLMITGAGGELFKDFWWLQDFPFYRRTANLSRLYSTRIVPIEPRHDYLAEPFATISRDLRENYLQTLKTYTAEDNTHTYDRIYYLVKMRDVIGRLMSNHSWLLHCYAPYLEPEIANVGYALPRSSRFFNLFHRQMLTRYNPATARVGTTESGMTVSSELSAVSADAVKYVANRMGRLARKFGQKLYRRRVLERGPTNPMFSQALRGCAATKNSLQKLKDWGVLRSNLVLDELEPSYCGTVLSLGVFIDWMECRRKFADPPDSIH